MRFLHLTWLAAGLAALLAGCDGSDMAPEATTGTARVHLITPQVLDFQLTRVSVETDTGFVVDLARDPETGAFGGSLSLPAGVHEITGRAFVDVQEVGASNPVPAEVQAGTVTQITIQILDTTRGRQPDFGAILESLTHPASTTAGTAVLLAASFIDPDGTPVSIDWSDDCADSSFTSPQDGVTGWSKTTPGTCRISVTASSDGRSVGTSFNLVVFEAGANQGAVEVDSEFISAPSLNLHLGLPDGPCDVSRFSLDASCDSASAAPTVSLVQVSVNWENATPGPVTLSDDCGGSFGVTFPGLSFVEARWLPPAGGDICRVTARAVSQEGVISEIAAAVLVRPGTAPQPTGAPIIDANGFFPAGFCAGGSVQGEVYCGVMQPAGGVNIDGGLNWSDTIPGSVALTDSCGGSFSNTFVDIFGGFYQTFWRAPATPAAGCAITITARSLEGVTRSAVLRLDVQ